MSLLHNNVVILGAGPAALGAATRLRQLGFNGCVYMVDDDSPDNAAPASSVRDGQGFLWETQGFGIASHHAWVDRVCDAHLPRNTLSVRTRVFADADADAEAQKRAYLAKAWHVTPNRLSSVWTTADAACLTGDRIDFPAPHASPGLPTRLAGTGGMASLWGGMARALPTGWCIRGRVVGLAPEKHALQIVRGDEYKHPPMTLVYHTLISTIGLDRLLQHVGMQPPRALPWRMGRVIVGLGFRGSPPPALQGCHHMLFVQKQIPFHRATLLGNIAAGYLPASETCWSATFDISVPIDAPVDLNGMVATVADCVTTRLQWVDQQDIISRFVARDRQGLPLPFLDRETAIDPLLFALEKQGGILSRGCLGAWRGELADADHDMMQGAEAVEYALNGVQERVFRRPEDAKLAHDARFTKKRSVADISGPLRLEIVVARYREDIAWLGDYALQAIVYNKGGDDLPLDRYPRQKVLPNIGREAHTYLHHIVNNYHQLADTTFFCQGRLDDSVDYYRGLEDTLRRFLNSPRDMVVFRRFFIFHWWQGIEHGGKWLQELQAGIMRRADMTPGQFWQYIFGEPPPSCIVWAFGATFAVRRSAVLARPRAFYERLLHHFERLNHINPEEGHYMERLWLSIFGAPAGSETLAEYGAFVLNAPEREVHTPPPMFKTDMLE